MMLEDYTLFVTGSIVLAIIPGPDMFYILSRSIAQGKKAGLMAAVGINVGGYCHLTAILLGLSAILAASPSAFTLVKWLGAAYLLYLGGQALMSPMSSLSLTPDDSGPQRLKPIFWQSFLCDVLNPKVAMFFLAFLPQFVDPANPHRLMSVLLLGMTVNIICLATNVSLVSLAARVTEFLRQNSASSRWLPKLMGIVFVTLGLRMAFA